MTDKCSGALRKTPRLSLLATGVSSSLLSAQAQAVELPDIQLLQNYLTPENWLLLQIPATLAAALLGAAAYALLRRPRRKTDPEALQKALNRSRPAGSLWRGLCHYTAQETGALLVTIHQPSDGTQQTNWPLREQWGHSDCVFANMPALEALRGTEARFYGLGATALPKEPTLADHNIIAGVSIPMLGDSGRIVGIFSAFFDTPLATSTPPAAMEQTASLLASLHSLQNISPLDFEQNAWDVGAIDKVPAAISINSADGTPLRMNDRYLAMFGEGDLEGDETHLDCTLTDLERPDAIENLFKAESELHRRKACVVRELVFSGEGKPRSLCYVGVPLVENNRLQGYFNMVLDPTETSDALALPRSLEQRALATVQCLEDALISVDNRGLIRYLNPAAQSLLQVELSQAAGLRLGDICRLLQADSREEIDLNNLLSEDFSIGPIDLDNTLLLSNDGREIALHISCSPVRNSDGIRQGSTFLLQDVTQQRRMAETLLRQANTDQLTGLENRQRFTQHLEKALREVRRNEVAQVLLYIDLDKFKLVNDSAGHIAGDALLQQLATLISTRLRDGDRLGRLGGDEFGVLISQNATKRAPLLAKQLVDDLSEFRFNWQGRSYDVRASIGIATVSPDVSTALELLQRAVVACQTAKDSGHWNFLVYGSSSSMPALRRKEMRAVSLVRDALENNRFRLFAQPIVAISDRAKAHGVQRYELLLRMLGENDEVLSPGAFMPAAERYGMMPTLDRWVIHYALEACAELHHNTSVCYELGINLSGASMSDPELLGFVQHEFARHGLQGNRVCFEITETEEITDIKVAQHFISEMRNEGCTFALDDFGSGLSSFTYLKELSVDYLKIDGSFVHEITRNSIDRSIVEGVVTVGDKIGLPTIAEFVENEETLQLLKNIGVDYAQGWHLGRARPLIELMGAVQQS